MSPARLYFVHLLMFYFPETKFFNTKRLIYSFAGVDVEKNVRICSSANIMGCGSLVIGKNTWVGHHVTIISNSSIVIGSNVDIAPKVFIGTGSHEIDIEGDRIAGKGTNHPVNVKDGAWLGTGSIVFPGITIGEKSVVAAGSVVTKSVPSHTVVAGVPARIIKILD